MTLIEIMVTVGIMGIVIAGTASMMAQMLRGQKTIEMRLAVQDLRENVRSFIVNEEAWGKTVEDLNVNQGGTCLADAASGYECKDVVDAGQAIPQIMDAAGGVKYESTAGPGNGFTATGAACDGTMTPYPSSQCPISMDISWKPDASASCANTGCKNPTAVITVDFTYDPGDAKPVPFNINRFDIEIRKPGVPLTLSFNCASVGGTFDQATQKCVVDTDPQQVCSTMGGQYDDKTQSCDMGIVPGPTAQQTCAEMGGTYNDQTKKCEFGTDQKTVCETVGGTFNATTGNCTLPTQVDNSIETTCESLGGKYNASKGTCNLGNPAKDSCLALGGTFNNGQCTLTQLVGDCPPGQVVVGFTDSGARRCASLRSMTGGACPAGEVSAGFKKDGTQICRSIVASIGNCGVNESFRGYDNSGAIICEPAGANLEKCPTGEALRGYRNDGTAICIAASGGSGGGSGGGGALDGRWEVTAMPMQAGSMGQLCSNYTINDSGCGLSMIGRKSNTSCPVQGDVRFCWCQSNFKQPKRRFEITCK
ncbi:MAG: type II secretion system protein [Bdellovibrionales bacterium]|nr:type II secretion system protein [Bdellovibrionales bacterium]